MSFSNSNQLKMYCFDSLSAADVVHGIYTRHGGVSPSPWRSLNLGGTVGDSRDNVVENRRRIFESIHRPVESIHDVWQIHSHIVLNVDTPRNLTIDPPKADAILTSNPQVTLFMRFADCVPIFLLDPIKKVVGIIHAGWQGTVKRLPVVTIQAMEKEYGSNPEDILAGIGPSICRDHYEVKDDVHNLVKDSFGNKNSEVLLFKNGRIYFDLWLANKILLEEAGVKKIEISNICTACNPQDWYSHRGEKGKTGRFGALIAIRDKNNSNQEHL